MNKDKEKLEKNRTLFSNSFASAFAGIQQQLPQSDRQYQTHKDDTGSKLQQYSEFENEDEFDERRLESPQKVATVN